MKVKYPKGEYKKIFEEVSKMFKGTEYSYGVEDEIYHSLKVFNLCDFLSSKIKKPHDKQILLLAALLHNLGKVKLGLKETIHNREKRKKHQKLGISKAKRILNKFGYEEKTTASVCKLIRFHEKRKRGKKSIELKILQDADLLAQLGIYQFIRPFMYDTQFKKSTLETIRYLKGNKWKGKLQGFNFEISKRLSKKLIKKCENLTEEFIKELSGNLK